VHATSAHNQALQVQCRTLKSRIAKLTELVATSRPVNSMDATAWKKGRKQLTPFAVYGWMLNTWAKRRQLLHTAMHWM
jgi:hypothetical protein